MRFLSSWLCFGIPSSMLAVLLGKVIGWSTAATVAVVAVIELLTVMFGIFCKAAKSADEQMHLLHMLEFEKEREQS